MCRRWTCQFGGAAPLLDRPSGLNSPRRYPEVSPDYPEDRRDYPRNKADYPRNYPGNGPDYPRNYPGNRSRPDPGPPAGRARTHPEGARRAGRLDAGRGEVPPERPEGRRSPSPRRFTESRPLGGTLSGADGDWRFHDDSANGDGPRGGSCPRRSARSCSQRNATALPNRRRSGGWADRCAPQAHPAAPRIVRPENSRTLPTTGARLLAPIDRPRRCGAGLSCVGLGFSCHTPALGVLLRATDKSNAKNTPPQPKSRQFDDHRGRAS